MNNITLVGRLTRDVELRYIQGSGQAVAGFALAVDREYSKDGKKETDFIDIQVWGKSAENCANYLRKGSMCAIQGSLRIEIYDKDGEKRKATKINASRVQFLDSKKKDENTNNSNSFEPSGLDPQGFEAIDDDPFDLPF